MKYNVNLATSAEDIDWTYTGEPLDLVTVRGLFFEAPKLRNEKDGLCFMPAAVKGRRRWQSNVTQIDMLVYDVDGHQTWQEVFDKLTASGVYALMYTTFNHMTAKTLIKIKHFGEWAKKNGIPKEGAATRENMNRYLTDKKKGHLQNVVYNVSTPASASRHVEKDCIVVFHDPLEKFRVVIPLASPIELSGDDGIARYKSIYYGVGAALDIAFDPACADPSRVHYMPACPESRLAEYKVMETGSREEPTLLDWTDETRYPRMDHKARWTFIQRSQAKAAKGVKSAKSAASSSGSHEFTGKRPPVIVTDKNGVKINLTRWSRSAERNFDVERLLERCLPPEDIKAPRSGGSGFHITCPHEDDHSNPGGSGTFVSNGDANYPWTINCRHNGCDGRGRLDQLAGLIEQGYVTADDIGYVPYDLPVSGSFTVPADELDNALDQFNDRWAVIRIGSKTRYMTRAHDGSPEFLTKNSFVDYHEACHYLWYDAITGKTKKAAFAPQWMKWQDRRQFLGYGFFPNPKDCPEGCFNAFEGWTLQPKKGSWKRLLAHIYRNVCRREPEYFRFLIAWLAQLVQEPHIKPGTNLVFKGAEGVGKSKLGEWIIALTGRHGISVSKAEQITGRFNGHIESCLFMQCEEAFWAGDKKAEGELKDLATAENYMYEHKGLMPYPGKNYTRLMITSNEAWVVPASSGGRRWFVLEVGDERKQDHDYFAAIDAEMSSGGLEAMLHDLLEHEISVNVRAAPKTPWLVEQRLHSLDNKRRWWREVLSDGGFRDHERETFVALTTGAPCFILRADVMSSAAPHFGNDRRRAMETEVGAWLVAMLSGIGFHKDGPRKDGERTYQFPPLEIMRSEWEATTGEVITEKEPAAIPYNATHQKKFPVLRGRSDVMMA